jgi:hypothetical protein
MSWKDLFIVSDEKSDEKSNGKDSQNKNVVQPQSNVFKQSTQSKYEPTFPQNNGSVFSPNPSVVPKSTYPEKNPYLDKILDVYDKGFTSLNQSGYDFFEFFKAVCTAGIDNSQVYQMALEMGKAMDQNVSKDSLLKQADYYITELNKVYSSFSTDGQNKMNDLSQKKNAESTSLSSTIASLKNQLSTIQDQIRIKENELSEIDNKYQPQIDEITLKLEANDSVKIIFIGNINKVKMNISNNLK